MTHADEHRLADEMIGAAQALEQAAGRLKAEARHLRRGELHESLEAGLWRMHKVADVKRAAEAALEQLGTRVSLIESAPLAHPFD